MDRILIIAGEVSGDHHGAALVKELKKLKPELKFFGIGGDLLKKEGMDILFHIEEMAFLGVGEVIRHLPFIWQVKNELIRRVKREQPLCALLIDYPGFNLRIAQTLKSLGIPILYYISPQLWAWGHRRVDKIRKYVDKMIVLFPFEEKFYNSHGIKADYVGHPLVDRHAEHLPKEIRKIKPGKILLGLLPGSRKQEIHSLLPKMIETARKLKKDGKINSVEIVKVSHLSMQSYEKFLKDDDNFITIIETDLYKRLPEYDAVLVASGTATLETGYYGVPMLIVYNVSLLTYLLGRMLIHVPFIGLVNIVAEKQVALELIQNQFTVKKAVKHLSVMLKPDNNFEIRKTLHVIREKLGAPGASKRAAGVVGKFIERQ
ncbi:MAG: lipid-A-disaccharide synthase [Calditrichaceae bacterium]|jgi:lipid-A-disaccharide synthase